VYVVDAAVTIRDNHVFGNADTGIYVLRSSVTVVGNHVYSNTQSGIELNTSTAAISGNSVTSNTYGGMRVSFSDAVLTGNVVSNNTYGEGGGLFVEESVTTLTGNTIISNTSFTGGGGLNVGGGETTLTGNTIVGNTGFSGGGIALYYGVVTLTNNIVADNDASNTGSGVYVATSSPRLVHNTIARNTGGDGTGIYLGNVEMEGPSSAVLTNTILVSHTVGIYVASGSTADMEATLWGSGEWANETDWGGEGTIITGTLANNHWGEPAFVDLDNGDYHIGEASVAIDKGVSAGVSTDIDGEPRFGIPDLGADEYWPPGGPKRVYLPLVLRQYP
jgi:parallel beta-helix repeat protein